MLPDVQLEHVQPKGTHLPDQILKKIVRDPLTTMLPQRIRDECQIVGRRVTYAQLTGKTETVQP